MTKTEAFKLFNTNRDGLAKILCVVPTAISKIPEQLPDKKRREIIGAAIDHRLDLKKVNKFTRQQS